MTLQNIFYFLGILYFIATLVIMVAMVYALWRLEKKIEDFRHNFVGKTLSALGENKSEIASLVGLGLTTFLASRIKKIFRR